MPAPMKALTIKLPADLHEAVQHAAAGSNKAKSVSDWLRRLITRELEYHKLPKPVGELQTAVDSRRSSNTRRRRRKLQDERSGKRPTAEHQQTPAIAERLTTPDTIEQTSHQAPIAPEQDYSWLSELHPAA